MLDLDLLVGSGLTGWVKPHYMERKSHYLFVNFLELGLDLWFGMG